MNETAEQVVAESKKWSTVITLILAVITAIGIKINESNAIKELKEADVLQIQRIVRVEDHVSQMQSDVRAMLRLRCYDPNTSERDLMISGVRCDELTGGAWRNVQRRN